MRFRLPIAVGLFAASSVLAACGGGGSSDGSSTTTAPSGGATASGGGGDVTIADFAFDPAEVEVQVGDTVTFTNEDDAAHTATAKEGDPTSFDTGEIAGGSSEEVTFDEAGEYAYYCSIHEYMKGTVRVLE